jgi:hypothetical protein
LLYSYHFVFGSSTLTSLTLIFLVVFVCDINAPFKRERKSTQVYLWQLAVACVYTIQTNRKHAQVYSKSPQLAKKFERVQSYRKSAQVSVKSGRKFKLALACVLV